MTGTRSHNHKNNPTGQGKISGSMQCQKPDKQIWWETIALQSQE